MKFIAHTIQRAQATEWQIIIQDGERTICNMTPPDNSVRECLGRFLKMAESDEEQRDLEHLVASATDLLGCYREEMDARTAFLNVVRALLMFLERQEGEELRTRYREEYVAFKRFLYEFRAYREYGHYVMEFFLAKDKLFEGRYPTAEYGWDSIPADICLLFLHKEYRRTREERRTPREEAPDDRQRKLQQRNNDDLEEIIGNYANFRDALRPDDSFVYKTFADFSKALVEFLERESATMGMYAERIPEICAFIVKNERDSLEEQKVYLNRILTSRESQERKEERLHSILDDVIADVTVDPDSDGTRLMTLVGLVSEHYLALYDLDKSADFWERARSRDWLLRFFLSLHRSMKWHFLGIVAFFLPLLGISALNWLKPPWLASAQPALSVVASLWITVALLLVLGVVIVTVIQAFRRRLLYSQLFLPRLLSASIVGLTPLLLDDLPWKIGVLLSPINWGVICLLVYLSSFSYIFIEVYNTVKLSRERSIEDALKSSWKIFKIGLVETFLVVAVASSLVFPVVGLGTCEGPGKAAEVQPVSAANEQVSILHRSCTDLGIIVHQIRLWPGWREWDGVSFGFFPSLVILWTGVALFVGSFVQLMWQERRITASV